MPVETHLSDVVFEVGFDDVWPRLTDPLGFPELFPGWTDSVVRAEDGTYRATGPGGDEFTIEPRTDRSHGVIDFEIVDADWNVERSRSRLFDLDDDRCLWVHLAVRWAGVDDREWEVHRRGTDADLANAKRVLESKQA